LFANDIAGSVDGWLKRLVQDDFDAPSPCLLSLECLAFDIM